MPYAQQIQNIIEIIRSVEDLMPGTVILHDISSWTVLYLSKRGRDLLGLSDNDWQKLNIETYHQQYFNSEDAAHYVPKLHAMMKRNQPGEVFTFFQQVRIAPHFKWVWHISSLKVLLRDEAGNPLLTITISAPIDSENAISAKMDRALEENIFIRRNIGRFNLLGKREREVLKKLSQGKNATEIADELFISVHTVNTHRKNIKAKLGITSAYELTVFARAFDLF